VVDLILRCLISSFSFSFLPMDGFSVSLYSSRSSRPFPTGCGCHARDIAYSAVKRFVVVAAVPAPDLGIRCLEGVNAFICRRDLGELLHVRRLRLRLYRLHHVGLALWWLVAPKAIGDRLAALLADARFAERLKCPGLWCLGRQGGDLRAQSLRLLRLLRLLARKPFLSEPRLRRRIVIFRPIRFDPEVFLLLSPLPLLLRSPPVLPWDWPLSTQAEGGRKGPIYGGPG
jgi:hypothetical protein